MPIGLGVRPAALLLARPALLSVVDSRGSGAVAIEPALDVLRLFALIRHAATLASPDPAIRNQLRAQRMPLPWSPWGP
jgi:hypothetical protein